MVCIGADGIFYDIHTDTTGRHTDRGFYSDARVNHKMAQLEQQGFPGDVYIDKGFDMNTNTVAAYQQPMTDEESRCNDLLTAILVPVEWGMRLIKMRCPVIKEVGKMHVFKSPILKILRVAVLLTNAYICFTGSGAGEYFGCVTPTLEEYFHPPAAL